MGAPASSDFLKFTLDDIAALDVLISVCDRAVGRQAAASAELRRLREQQTRAAWNRAGKAFDALPAATRRVVAAQSGTAARAIAAKGFSNVSRRLGLIAALNARKF